MPAYWNLGPVACRQASARPPGPRKGLAALTLPLAHAQMTRMRHDDSLSQPSDPWADQFGDADPSSDEETVAAEPSETPGSGSRAWQLSLLEVALLVSLAAGAFALSQFFGPDNYAGVLGGVVLASLAIQSLLHIEGPWWTSAWWLLLLIYLAACGIALFAN